MLATLARARAPSRDFNAAQKIGRYEGESARTHVAMLSQGRCEALRFTQPAISMQEPLTVLKSPSVMTGPVMCLRVRVWLVCSNCPRLKRACLCDS